MKTVLRLGAAAAFLAINSVPTFASLETGESYSALPKDEIAMNEYTQATTCSAAEPRYLPSFIRAPDGTIIGVGYVALESDSNC